MTGWKKLGVIAGGGPLGALMAKACFATGRPCFVIRLAGFADHHVENLPGASCGLGEAGKLIRLLKENDCDGVVLAGLVQRPDFSALKLDWRGAALLPKVAAAAAGGDGPLLSVVVDVLEDEGFRVFGAEEILSSLSASQGVYGANAPSDRHLADIKKAASLIDALGPYDVGQGAVVSAGHVLAVEAAEGTDAMLRRCSTLPDNIRGGEGLHGVLVKRPKPQQELRVDLPTIGVETIRGAAKAKLAGIAVEAGRALVIDREEVVSEANSVGLFVYGFTAEEVMRK